MVIYLIETELAALKREKEVLDYTTYKTGEDFSRYRKIMDEIYKYERALKILKN